MPAIQELIEGCQEMWPDFTINENLLQHPTSDFVKAFYCRFMESITNTVNYIGSVENVPLFKESGSDWVINLVCNINKYLKVPMDGCDMERMKLTLTDIYEPSSKRTVVRFKLLLEMLILYNNVKEGTKNVFSTVQDKKKAFEDLKIKKEQLREQLAKEAEKLALGEQQIDKLKKQNQLANNRHKNLLKISDDYKSEQMKLQQEVKKLFEVYDNKKKLLESLQEEISTLNNQIVTEEGYSSFESLVEITAKKTEDMESETQLLAKNLPNKLASVEHFKKVYAQVQSLLCESRACSRIEEGCLLEVRQKMKQIENKLYETSADLSSKQTIIIKLKESIKMLKENRQTTKLMHNSFKQNTAVVSKQQLDELMEEQNNQANVHISRKILESEKSDYNNNLEKLKVEILVFNQQCGEMYKELLESENEMMVTFTKVIEKLDTKLNIDK